MKAPSALAWWRLEPGGAAWLDSLPGHVAACCERWRLTPGVPFDGGNVALVLRVRREDGGAAVLKLSFPDRESEHEADALAHWEDAGAVRLLEHDPARHAMLLEHVSPGTPLWEVEDDVAATEIAAGVLRRLHAVPVHDLHRFRSLAKAAAEWQETIPADWEASGRAYPRRLVDLAVDACRLLVTDASDVALLHQDFHGGNVLLAGDADWRVIDPKPVVGDPAFDAASLVRDRRWLLGTPGDAARLRTRLDVLRDATALDRERMRLWGIVHALAWGVSAEKLEPDMVRCAELLASL